MQRLEALAGKAQHARMAHRDERALIGRAVDEAHLAGEIADAERGHGEPGVGVEVLDHADEPAATT